MLDRATEMSKLSPGERRQVVERAAEDLPLTITVFGRTPSEKIRALRHAQAVGAAWVILRPPPKPGWGLAQCWDRDAAMAPMPFGLACVERLGAALEPFGPAREQ